MAVAAFDTVNDIGMDCTCSVAPPSFSGPVLQSGNNSHAVGALVDMCNPTAPSTPRKRGLSCPPPLSAAAGLGEITPLRGPWGSPSPNGGAWAAGHLSPPLSPPLFPQNGCPMTSVYGRGNGVCHSGTNACGWSPMCVPQPVPCINSIVCVPQLPMPQQQPQSDMLPPQPYGFAIASPQTPPRPPLSQVQLQSVCVGWQTPPLSSRFHAPPGTPRMHGGIPPATPGLMLTPRPSSAGARVGASMSAGAATTMFQQQQQQHQHQHQQQPIQQIHPFQQFQQLQPQQQQNQQQLLQQQLHQQLQHLQQQQEQEQHPKQQQQLQPQEQQQQQQQHQLQQVQQQQEHQMQLQKLDQHKSSQEHTMHPHELHNLLPTPPQRRRVHYRALVEWQREIEEAFSTFDVDNVGFIDYDELKAALRALDLPIHKTELREAMRTEGCLESGCVDYDAFSNILMQQFMTQDPLDATLKSFRLFDREGRGRISLASLRRVAQESGQLLDESDFQNMISLFDSNCDGEIDEAEFARAMSLTGLR
eukprot:TRINITY_DN15719_c0_g2_i1.p1 TRINITY_DN15719_c0_g2~~TRINITY_DN15719_c0_g2_i1.p1  ORF type:complete len:530 (+),score=118.94 TRINITY_DN15719_c0_g2_i1:116-1705(+)